MSDAERVRDVLVEIGLAVHVAEPDANQNPFDPAAGQFRVSVDNRRVDAARRAIAHWRKLEGADD
jgi:hypothetical protein